jgi:hypothetical protein
MTIGFDSTPWYSELVARVFGDQEIVPPGIELASDEPHWQFWRKKLWGGHRGFTAAGVGIFNGFGVLNPVGSRQLVVVTRVANEQAQQMFISEPQAVAVPANYTPLSGAWSTRDTRINNLGTTRLNVTSLTKVVGGASGTINTNNKVLNVSPAETPDDWFVVLAPGGWVVVEANAANVPNGVDFDGYVIVARAEELQP